MEIGVDGLAMVDVLDTAKDWWKSNRPVGWSEEQHIKDPCVNACCSLADKRLATAVCRLVELERMP